jgi:glucosylceramidase
MTTRIEITNFSRREFLRTASSATALVALQRTAAWAQSVRAPARSVQVWATHGLRRHEALDPLAWTPVRLQAADAIVIDPASVKQEILGFGGALTDAACYVISQMPEGSRAALLKELFSPGEMALNVCRTTIGASDYSLSAYTYDESPTPDPELKKFSIDHDKAYILPTLREARAVNPGLFLFSSPWSPPGWMKSSNTIFGGAMRFQYLGPYAEYFRRFLAGYQAEGVEIDAVTVQNETDSEQEGQMPQCQWGQQYEIAFVKSYLEPALRKAGLKTKIWVLDHNYDLWGRALDELSDAQANEFIDGIAWHPYMGEVSSMSLVHNLFPAKNAYYTEGGPDLAEPDYLNEWTKWGEIFNGVLNNWARSITSWNLALDENGKPNLGPFHCGGVVTVENGSHKVVRSGQYWALAHYSKHIQRGARVVATNSIEPPPRDSSLLGDLKHSTALTHCGFVNPDGSMVMVLANRGGQRQAQVVLGDRQLELNLPPDSLFTLRWNPNA